MTYMSLIFAMDLDDLSITMLVGCAALPLALALDGGASAVFELLEEKPFL